MFKYLAGAIAALLLATVPANAVVYQIDYTGSDDYTLSGLLTFDDSLIGTGVIDETDIDNLYIEVFLSGVSQGSWDMLVDGFANADLANDFNLNFDTDIGQFVVGGFSGDEMGQDWNVSTGGLDCVGVGFSSGSGSQGICVDGTFGGSVSISQPTLTATLLDAPEVPLPAAAPLMLSALALGGVIGRKKRKAA